MAAGLPVVANPFGSHFEMVSPGRNGCLASSPGDWARAVRLLISDAELRRRMGQAGRRQVEQSYSVDRWGPCFARLMAELTPSGMRRGPRVGISSAELPDRSELSELQVG
jgi:glycosyltransferase involved in cell wall biosynthesis